MKIFTSIFFNLKYFIFQEIKEAVQSWPLLQFLITSADELKVLIQPLPKHEVASIDHHHLWNDKLLI